MGKKEPKIYPAQKKVLDKEVFIFIVCFLGFFWYLGSVMGVTNMLNTLMNTAYKLLMETVFYILAIAVLAGAISALFSEFGVIALLNKLLSPVVELIYGLPGASAVGIFTTYLSDNPAILTLADDNNFRRYFKKYQLPALTNIGTAFGMGLIITTFMLGLGKNFGSAVLVGNLGAIIGSVVSTRLMLRHTKKLYGTEAPCELSDSDEEAIDVRHFRKVGKHRPPSDGCHAGRRQDRRGYGHERHPRRADHLYPGADADQRHARWRLLRRCLRGRCSAALAGSEAVLHHPAPLRLHQPRGHFRAHHRPGRCRRCHRYR